MRQLYPAIEARKVYRLDVGGGHALHVEDCGRADGVPVVFLHGGPGSGCKPYHRQFFRADAYRIVVFDQRGAGRSTPRGAVNENDTGRLVADIERIRVLLGIDRWLVFGGSWGAALALVYAQTHPDRVLGLVLRGTFLARDRDVEWFFGDGARRLFPEHWAALCAVLGAGTGRELVARAYTGVHGGDRAERERVARAWARWAGAVVAFSLASTEPPSDGDLDRMLDEVAIETHYAHHHYFLEPDQILANMARIAHLPATIIHGRRDLTCTPESAWAVHEALPGSALVILHEAGHLASEPAMIDALVGASDAMAARLAGQ